MIINKDIKNKFSFTPEFANKPLDSFQNSDGNIVKDNKAGVETIDMSSEVTYKVKPGDTLSKIAAANNTTVEEIVKANNIKDPNKIYVGNELKLIGSQPVQVQAQKTVNDNKVETTDVDYKVKPGDTLSKIAAANNTTVEELVKNNNIKDPNKIYVGDTITIKAKTEADSSEQDVAPVQKEIAETTPSEFFTSIGGGIQPSVFTDQITEEPVTKETTTDQVPPSLFNGEIPITSLTDMIERKVDEPVVEQTAAAAEPASTEEQPINIDNVNVVFPFNDTFRKLEYDENGNSIVRVNFSNLADTKNSEEIKRPKPNVIKISDITIDNTLTKSLNSIFEIDGLLSDVSDNTKIILKGNLDKFEELLKYQALMDDDIYKNFVENNPDGIDEKIKKQLEDLENLTNIQKYKFYKSVLDNLDNMTNAQKYMLSYLLEYYSARDASDFFNCIQFSINDVKNVKEVERLLGQVNLDDLQQINDLLLNVFADDWLSKVFNLTLTPEQRLQKNVDRLLFDVNNKILAGKELTDAEYQKLILLQYLKDNKGDKLVINFDNVLYDDIVKDIVNPVIKDYQLVGTEDSLFSNYSINQPNYYDNDNLVYDTRVYADAMKKVLEFASDADLDLLSQKFVNIDKSYLTNMKEILSDPDINIMAFEKGFYDGKKGEKISPKGCDKKSYAAGLLLSGLTDDGNTTISYQDGSRKIDLSKIINKYAQDPSKDLAKAYSQVQFNDCFVDWLKEIAFDNRHGYSKPRRTGNPDFDCSSLVYYGLLNAGYTKAQLGYYPLTTSTEESTLVRTGDFEVLTYKSGMKLEPGDILWRGGHTEIYVGDGMRIGAHNDYDHRIGDSGGNEISMKSMTNYWIKVFRHKS